MAGNRDEQAAYLAMVDPELREAALRMKQQSAQYTPMTLEKLALRRSVVSANLPASRPDVSIAPRRISGMSGQPEVTVFVVNAKPGSVRPAILHMHGGGFNASSARAILPSLQTIAERLDCVIVTVEYRLAPEAGYADSTRDNYAGLLWLYANAESIGVDRSRIAIAGESAGGGHAALLAIRARDCGEVPVVFQCLTYPMLDDSTGSSRHLPGHFGAFGWSADSNRFAWQCFLGRSPGGRDVPVAAVPARTAELKGLPPTFIAVGSLDLFLEEDIEFARRLADAAVPIELLVVPGAFHGFDVAAPSAVTSRRFLTAKIDALGRAFQRSAG